MAELVQPDGSYYLAWDDKNVRLLSQKGQNTIYLLPEIDLCQIIPAQTECLITETLSLAPAKVKSAVSKETVAVKLICIEMSCLAG